MCVCVCTCVYVCVCLFEREREREKEVILSEVILSELPAMYPEVLPATSCPVNRDTSEECLLLESFQKDVHLFFKVYDVTSTKYLEMSSSRDQIVLSTVRNELWGPE